MDLMSTISVDFARTFFERPVHLSKRSEPLACDDPVDEVSRQFAIFVKQLKYSAKVQPGEDGARCRVRTCDFLRVKQALYH